ncbi:MAG: tol-pal system protein YbgF [Nitrospirae bacterium]|nr:tol-pal system protein YbgF [Nitrospirota bacterium]
MLQSNKSGKGEVGSRKYCSLFTPILLTSYFLLLTSIIFAGCATSQDIGRIQFDINESKSEIKDIKQKIKALESQLPEQSGELNKHLKELGEEQKATKSAVSDILTKVHALTGELQIITGRFEEARYFSEKTSKELMESKDTLIAKVKELEISVNELKGKLARLGSATAPDKNQNPAEDVKKVEEPKEEQEISEREVKDVYMEAYETHKSGKFSEAREKFLSLLKNYPENEYSDNARFWIGESYYIEKNYEDAIIAYEELLKKNREGKKASAAMLKQGLAFYELKDEKTGKIILEKLINKFPDSEEVELAKKKLSPPASTTKQKQ